MSNHKASGKIHTHTHTHTHTVGYVSINKPKQQRIEIFSKMISKTQSTFVDITDTL